MTIHWKAVELLIFQFYPVILEDLTILDMALSGEKGLNA